MTICDVCGREINPEDCVQADVTLDDLTCPTPMNFHLTCLRQARTLWQSGQDSLCAVDPEFPETMRWTPVREASRTPGPAAP
jgi:hypothetical protein